MPSSFEKVTRWNQAIGNPVGSPDTFSVKKLSKQLLSIPDELGETFIAMGADETRVKALVTVFKAGLAALDFPNEMNIDGVRDGLIDQHVFLYGGHHIIGVNADEDMESVIQGLYTRFIKNEEDEIATIKKHAANGIVDVYFEGEYPVKCMKSGSDQPDAPTGKFLKSASFTEPKFAPVPRQTSFDFQAEQAVLSKYPDYGTADAPKMAPAVAGAINEVHPDAGRRYTFDEFVQYGRDHGANIVNGMPWSFKFHGHAVSHETDDHYLICIPHAPHTLHFFKGHTVGICADGFPRIFPESRGTSGPQVATGAMNDEARKLLDRHNASIAESGK